MRQAKRNKGERQESNRMRVLQCLIKNNLAMKILSISIKLKMSENEVKNALHGLKKQKKAGFIRYKHSYWSYTDGGLEK